jgi:hypothetical protein
MPKFAKKRAYTPEDDESAGEQTFKPSKKSKGSKSGKTTDAEGPFWEVWDDYLKDGNKIEQWWLIRSSCRPSDASTSQSSTRLSSSISASTTMPMAS